MTIEDIEDIYELSPLQEGMLFHTLYAPESALYFEQLCIPLYGPLDVSALEHAWQQVVDRHTALRTSFEWEEGDKPLQVVHRRVKLSLEQQNWSNLSPAEQVERLEAYLKADRERGFELSEPPLMRLALIRVAEHAYQFVFSLHHLLLDGWSSYLINTEAAAFYEASCQGRTLEFEPSRPYGDYIAWLQQQDLSKAEGFWRRVLAGYKAPPPLGVSRATGRLSDEDEGYDAQQIKLSVATTAALQALARQHQLTLNTLVQGAWALLLSRYTGEEDVVFGATTSGRPPTLKGVESMVGLFINTLPVRVRVSPQAPLIPWLKELQAQQFETRQYEYSPLVKVQGWSEVPRGLPLFESILAFENFPTGSLLQEEGGAQQDSHFHYFGKTNYPLSILVRPSEDLLVRMMYVRPRFDPTTISRMVGHFQTLLEGMAANPEQCLSELPLLTETERHQLLVEWNATTVAYPRDMCIHELFEAQAERTPEAIAVVCQGEQLTYGELNWRANQLAHHLQALGVGPETLVGICMERSLEMVIGLLGILKAGGAYVPLDPLYPKERLAFMMDDAGVPMLVTEGRLLERLPEHRATVICMDIDWEVIAGKSKANLVSGVKSENLAYVIYTSGSTGRPKGALLAHRGLCNVAEAQSRAFDVRSDSRILQFASLNFDASIFEIAMALRAGATLCLGTVDSLLPGSTLIQLLRDQAISIVTLPPSALAALPVEQLPALQTILVAGEVFSADLVARWATGYRFFNLYGPTESTIWATVAECVDGNRRPDIGRPIANIQVYVLDCQLQPVPVGVPGELYIGGDGLARGYLNRPELTAEKFITHPFSQEPGARLYKTGDLVCYQPDGNLEFLGRLDQQVKLHGFRIELGEVETVLSQHPAVQESVVLAREDRPGDKRLVAYLVPDQEPAPSVSELRGFLQRQLPEYMVPSAFVLLDALPLTPNGKVDRQALPAPGPARPMLEATFVAPVNPIEKTLAEIWTQVLGLERVGIYDNFFELGGDSILSLQVIARAKQAGIQLTLKQLFQNQTIAQLAAVADTTPTIHADQGMVLDHVSLTPIQRWFFEQNSVDPHHFNQAILLEVRQALTPALLARVVQHLLVHHDALRLRFEQRESGWQQFHAGLDDAPVFSRLDLSALPEPEQKNAIELKAAEMQASLNLSAGPLLRVVLFDLGPSTPNRLLLVIHHLAIDTVSWTILMEDLWTGYLQLIRGETIKFPPKTTSFKYWAQRLTEHAQSAALQHEMAYWLAVSGTRGVILPTDHAGGSNTAASARTVSVSLSVEETQALLHEVPKAYQTQINDVLLTALVQAFAKWTGEPSLLIDLEGHGREPIFEDVDLSRTVGWFTTICPVWLELEGVTHPGEALKLVKEQLRRIPNRGIGYGLLRYLSRDAQLAAKLQALPQAEVSFNYLGQFGPPAAESSPLAPARESYGPTSSPRSNRSHLLGINGSVAESRFQLDWTYSENVHQRSTIDRLAQDFMQALRSLIAHCQSPEAGGYTPSDFSQAKLSQKDLDKLIATIGQSYGRPSE
jgi:amino acid adenylation domain-containing protein/non-ribosomal peptide synthase protein (TIGR01720 family)